MSLPTHRSLTFIRLKGSSAFSLCLFLTLTACGGGGSSGDPNKTDQDDSAFQLALKNCSSEKAPLIQMFGDSTQWEQFDSLQRWMDDWYGKGAVRVSNLGVSGTSAADFPFNSVDASAITVVNFGVNDVRQDNATVSAYKDRLRKISVTAYETPSPPYDGFAQAMREVAAERQAPVIDVSARVREQTGWRGQIHDGVHPNAFLYEWITSQVVGPSLRPLIEQRLCQMRVHREQPSKKSWVRMQVNSARILWGIKGSTSQGQITFENLGQAPASLSFSGLQAPYSSTPAQCNLAANGGTCTITVSMAASSTLGGQGTQYLTATGGANGPLSVIVWGSVTDP